MGYEITLSGKMINYIWPSRKLAQTCFKISTSSLSLEQIQDMWLYTFSHAQTPLLCTVFVYFLNQKSLSNLWPLVSLADVLSDLVARSPHLILTFTKSPSIKFSFFLPRHQCTGMFYSTVAFRSSSIAEPLSLTLLSELLFTRL